MTQIIYGFHYPGDSAIQFRRNMLKLIILIGSALSSIFLTLFDFFLLPPIFFGDNYLLIILCFFLDFLVKSHLLIKIFSLISHSDVSDVQLNIQTLFFASLIYFNILIYTEIFFIFYPLVLFYQSYHRFKKRRIKNIPNQQTIPMQQPSLEEQIFHPFPGIEPKINLKTKHGKIIKFDDKFIYTVEGENINVFEQPNLERPSFILKGHGNAVRDLFVTKEFLISYGGGFGLWDKSDSFAFSDLAENVFPHLVSKKSIRGGLSNLQIVDNVCYYSVENSIYCNDSSFRETSHMIVNFSSEGTLEEFKIFDDSIYCRFFDNKSQNQKICVYNMPYKNLQYLIQEFVNEDTDYDNVFGDFVITSSSVIVSNTKEIRIYKQENLTLVKKLKFDDYIHFIGANSHYYLTAFIHIDEHTNGREVSFRIYSNTKEFEHFKDFKNQNIFFIQIDPDFDSIIVGNDKGVIQSYNIKDVILFS